MDPSTSESAASNAESALATPWRAWWASSAPATTANDGDHGVVDGGGQQFRGVLARTYSSASDYLSATFRRQSLSASAEEGHLLRESEALLAIIRSASEESAPMPPSSESTEAPPRPPALSAAADERLIAAHGTAQLPAELALFVSNAQLPVGAELCQMIAEIRREFPGAASHAPLPASTPSHFDGETSPSTSSRGAGGATPGGSAATAGEALRGVLRLGRSCSLSGRSTSSPAVGPEAAIGAALGAAIRRVHDGLASLFKTLEAHLPAMLREDPSSRQEARAQLEGAAHRALFSILSPLYLQAHAEEIGNLASRCHELRRVLPSDMHQLPRELWLLPASSLGPDPTPGAGGDGLCDLRAGKDGDPRLPYASAIQLLRTISFYRTPNDKAKVLLEACEEVVKCATRALRLHASAASPGHATALGADDLLPLVVYVLVRSGIYSLPAELAYVADFLGENRIHGKEGYALVSLQCACRVAGDLAWGRGLLLGATRPSSS